MFSMFIVLFTLFVALFSAKQVATPKVQLCTVCGKPVKNGNCGPHCTMLQKIGRTKLQLAQAKQAITMASQPAGFVTVANMHRWLVSHKGQAPTVSAMVTSMGGDGPYKLPAHPALTPLIFGNNRYLPGSLATLAGCKQFAPGTKVTLKATPQQLQAYNALAVIFSGASTTPPTPPVA